MAPLLQFAPWLLPPGANPLFHLWLPLAAAALALLAQARVKSTFARWSRTATRSGLTGAEVAELLLRSRGIADVRVEPVRGLLSDHYDPRSRTLRLSEQVYGSRSIAALGVAAHEAGHALQHADAYAWLTLRSRLVPVVAIGSTIGGWLFPIGVMVALASQNAFGQMLLFVAALGFAAVVLFSLVTLPVEIDASRRALSLLSNSGVLVGAEQDGARAVLRAAAWTYVAAAAAAIVELLKVLALLAQTRRRES
ncbi:MAG: zinc metallopeptidase [Planctomycetes bacterium]|nr:zinc metallopeptidase [Planctomycetota bacterium]